MLLFNWLLLWYRFKSQFLISCSYRSHRTTYVAYFIITQGSTLQSHQRYWTQHLPPTQTSQHTVSSIIFQSSYKIAELRVVVILIVSSLLFANNCRLLNNNHIVRLQKGVFNGLKELRYLYAFTYIYSNDWLIDSHFLFLFYFQWKIIICILSFESDNDDDDDDDDRYLYKNRIKEIDRHTFHDLPKLEQL